jgi:hypothetical protein
MKNAILIGFEYNSLPGAIIDLYLAIKWCHSLGLEINVITDIKDIDNDLIFKSVEKRIVANDIFHIFDTVSLTIVNDKNKFVNTLSELCKLNTSVIYFTGHSDIDKIILPENNFITFSDFKNLICINSNINSNLFIIMDCCFVEGLYLQYKLHGNSFIVNKNNSYISQKILLVASSNCDQKSLATKYGSVFSKIFFQKIYKFSKKSNIKELCDTISVEIKNKYPTYNQSVSIYSSEIIETDLWLYNFFNSI